MGTKEARILDDADNNPEFTSGIAPICGINRKIKYKEMENNDDH